MSEFDVEVYRRSWDSFIDAFSDKKREAEEAEEHFLALAVVTDKIIDRLRQIDKTKKGELLIKEYEEWRKLEPKQASQSESE